jgi:flagellar M-ring protein FliF
VNKLLNLWKGLGTGARWQIVIATVVICALTAWVGVRILRVDYDVLFSQLAAADAATILDRLKQLKVPYVLADDGATIEVPATQVHEVRLRLMSGGVPLSGNVGFEIFDKQGLGATEQSQRVSYQRALQGELARTISTLNDVKQARVHLVLPESTLFRKDRQESRAAVTLTLKPGATLSREQIVGIQRLVAASVPGLEVGKVVITDQRGVTLSAPDSQGSNGEQAEAQLSMKRELEDYVTRKVARLLDSTYGPGQAIVSADIVLNFDEIHRTVQELEPSAVRRRRQVFAGAPPADAAADPSPEPATDTASHSVNSRSSTDVEYDYGRRVEQVIAAPGGVTRISIGVVVPGDMTPEKQQRITDLVRMAAGVNEQRGDAIVVQSLSQIGGRTSEDAKSAPEPAAAPGPVARESVVPAPSIAVPLVRTLRAAPTAFVLAGVGLVIGLLVSVSLVQRRRSRLSIVSPAERGRLSPADRQRLLVEIERTLSGQAALGAVGHKQ